MKFELRRAGPRKSDQYNLTTKVYGKTFKRVRLTLQELFPIIGSMIWNDVADRTEIYKNDSKKKKR